MKFRIALLVLSASALCFAQKPYCGVERTAVKDLQDPEAKQVHFDAKPETIAALRKLPAPAKISNSMPRQDGEKQVYQVEAQIIGYKFEDNRNGKTGDGDYHVQITTVGNPRESMILEIPDPACAPPAYAKVFAELRAFIDSLGPRPGPTFHTLKAPVPVIAAGVPFFDKVHGTHKNLDGTIGQVGVAPNGIELHPALSLKKQ